MNPTHVLISTQINGLEKNGIGAKIIWDALKILFRQLDAPLRRSNGTKRVPHKPNWSYLEGTSWIIHQNHDKIFPSPRRLFHDAFRTPRIQVTNRDPFPSTKQRCILLGKGTYHWSEVRCPLAEWLSKYPQHLKFHWNPAHWTHMTELIGYGSFLKWWVSPTNMGFPTKDDQFGVEIGGTTI